MDVCEISESGCIASSGNKEQEVTEGKGLEPWWLSHILPDNWPIITQRTPENPENIDKTTVPKNGVKKIYMYAD